MRNSLHDGPESVHPGRIAYVKQIMPVRRPETCAGCHFNNDTDCQEGYYGVRLYRDRTDEYQVGVCIQRMDLRQPLDAFVTSDLRHEIKRDLAASLPRAVMAGSPGRTADGGARSMDWTGRGDRPEEVDRPALSEASTLVEGRWRSLDEKVAWMLKGREQVDHSSELAEHASTRDAPSNPDMVLTPSFPRDIRIPSEDLKRAGLPDLSDRAVTLYLATHRQDRPWLNIVGAYDSAALRRAIATMDQGGGHTLERHSPSGSAEDHKRRVERLEDPAQTDPQLREQGVDGLTGKEHYCADSQSRFTDVGAMTTALARALADPKLKAALETPYTRRDTPGDVVIPIADLLGADGHLSCEGFRLAGEPKVALAERRAWAKERRDWLRQHGTVDGFASEPPPAERIPSFEGGTIRFRIWHNKDQTGYEISSFYPEAATEKGSSSR